MPQVLSFSSIRDWKTCRQLSYYKRVKKLRKKRVGLPLKRGDLIHRVIEAYYKGEWWPNVIEAAREEFAQLTEEEREFYGSLPDEVERLMTGYFKKYEGMRGNTIGVELEFGQNRGPDIELLPGVFVRGKIDRVFSDHRGVWVEEHKSTSMSWPTEGFRLYDLQSALYIKVVEKLKLGKPVGVVYDYIKTRPPTIPKLLKKGGLSRAKKLRTDYETYLNAIKLNGLNPADYQEELERAKQNVFYERKYLPKPDNIVNALLEELRVISIEMPRLINYPYRNLRRECETRCEFYSLCSAEIMGLDVDFILKTEYATKLDPEFEGGESFVEEEESTGTDEE